VPFAASASIAIPKTKTNACLQKLHTAAYIGARLAAAVVTTHLTCLSHTTVLTVTPRVSSTIEQNAVAASWISEALMTVLNNHISVTNIQIVTTEQTEK